MLGKDTLDLSLQIGKTNDDIPALARILYLIKTALLVYDGELNKINTAGLITEYAYIYLYAKLEPSRIEDTKKAIDFCLDQIKADYPNITNIAALHILDKVKDNLRSTKKLLDKSNQVVEDIKQEIEKISESKK